MAHCNCNFISYTLARSVSINILLPGPVFSDQNPCHIPPTPYPVLYLLHGGEGNENAWLRYTSLERYAEERQIAVVTCGLENSAGYNAVYQVPFGVSSFGKILDPRLMDQRTLSFFQFLKKELPEYISATFPVSTYKKDTYIAGDGYAAYTALTLALSLPGQYCAAGLFFPKQSLLYKEIIEKEAGKNIFEEKMPSFYLSLPQSISDIYMPLNKEIFFKTWINAASDWEFCDQCIEHFLDWLPRTDRYAELPRRKI